MALSNVNANDVALAADLNQYKEALEGTRDFSPLLKAASSQDFYIRMSNTGGGQFFKVQNSSSVDALVVNSNGVVTPTTLQITGLAAPADATAGRMSYNTTKNVLVYGNGTQIVEVADGASTNVAVLSAEQTVNNSATLQTVTDFTTTLVASGTYVAEMLLVYLTGTTPDIKLQWDISQVPGCTIEWGQTGASAINASTSPTASTSYNQMHTQAQTMILSGQGTGADNKVVVPLFATIHNSTTAAALNFQFAQNVADSSDTKLLVGSYMKITRNA